MTKAKSNKNDVDQLTEAFWNMLNPNNTNPALTPERKMITPPTLDIANRPIVKSPQGGYATVRSIGVEIDGRHYLIPTVIGNKIVSNREAINHFIKSGEHLGEFNSEEAANEAGQKLHEEQAQMYGAQANQLGYGDYNG